jgi:hypothetical protein
MEYRNLGKSDLKLSVITFGAWAAAMASDYKFICIAWRRMEIKEKILFTL